MARTYRLDAKINALNQLERNEGDVALTSRALGIPARTLRDWRRKETDLRRRHRQRQRRLLARLKLDMQVRMLERGQAVLARIDDETLAKAPLNQLASALGVLMNYALKLEEAIDDSDEQAQQVVRFEYYYDGEVQDAPPWTGAGAGKPRAVQGGRLRTPLGQNRVGQDPAAGSDAAAQGAQLVAGADLSDSESGLARFEDEPQEDARHRD